ncbi:MAG TPA: tRNA (adenosine(37)-N6)-threonylcarbamoyltransferase complex dimerization subunit type 1 TsaB [Candidatus Limnocylindrales bacterium]|nr:tRNA (adenosine(37)-N6)-threonylcarbamoyltransferase complex dimerization subunit type 1 TsaB [Candidatus Limnocylindrales bacterium]
MTGGWLLAIDTATSVVNVAAGDADGSLRAARTFAAEHRHGSHLLPAIDALLETEGLSLAGLRGVVVGLGPGAFTGLRVGLATAKTLAHALGIPIVGVSTAEVLLAAEAEEAAGDASDVAAAPERELLLPAGPHDRVRIVPGGTPRLETGAIVPERPGAVAVDLDGRASEAALARGRRALHGFPAALLRLGAARLGAVGSDDVERLVPEYVSLPRGVTTDLGEGGVAWSRDPR